jgi:glycine/D-amino acid oxidase-like deaminating enzyme
MATNAYSPLLDDYFSQLVFPVRGQMMATDPDHPNAMEDSTYYANFGYDYFRQPCKGVIMMGGLRNRFVRTEVGYEDSTTAELQQGLENYVHRTIGVERYEVTARWSGIMGNTIDGLPLVGALPHNNAVIAVVGCNGHGFGLGMKMAHDLSSALLTSETSDLLSRFSLKRFLR